MRTKILKRATIGSGKKPTGWTLEKIYPDEGEATYRIYNQKGKEAIVRRDEKFNLIFDGDHIPFHIKRTFNKLIF